MSISNIASKIKKHGIKYSVNIVVRLVVSKICNAYYHWSVRNVNVFCNPTDAELVQIEDEFIKLNEVIEDYTPRAHDFSVFESEQYFPLDCHGGINGHVWHEKLLEHWIAAEKLGLKSYKSNDIYLDIAAGHSPWVKILRDRFQISAYAIDLGDISDNYKSLPYYIQGDATATRFDDESVTGASLQCAFEMFTKDDDINLIKEIARVLKPSGKFIILPLYLHTHYCAFSSPDYYGKGHTDKLAKEYVCCDWNGIPSARFYDAQTLKSRILKTINSLGMQYKILILKNKNDFGDGIYCHFILEVIK